MDLGALQSDSCRKRSWVVVREEILFGSAIATFEDIFPPANGNSHRLCRISTEKGIYHFILCPQSEQQACALTLPVRTSFSAW
jgi:hypothetical protein